MLNSDNGRVCFSRLFFPRRGEYTGSLELVKDLEPENSKETKCGFFFFVQQLELERREAQARAIRLKQEEEDRRRLQEAAMMKKQQEEEERRRLEEAERRRKEQEELEKVRENAGYE